MREAFLCVALLTVLGGGLSAQTVRQVTNLNDSGTGSLRDAIGSSTSTTPGDIINFTVAGTINLASELVIAKPLTIVGPTGSPGITIDGGSATRCIQVLGSSSQATLHIENIRLLNGRATGSSTSGGGIRLSTLMTVELENVTFEDCTAPGDGGGLQISSALTVMLTDCSFHNNQATLNGGAVNNFGTPFSLTGCTFTGNSISGGGYGGAVNAGSGAISVDGCTFANNAGGFGGGLYLSYNPGTITDTTFTGNAGGNGGGVAVRFGSSAYSFERCTFNANQAAFGGGVFVWADNTSLVTFTNCTFSANTGGGGLYVGGSETATNPTAELTNCTFAGDTATTTPGNAISLQPYDAAAAVTVTLRNTIVDTSTPCFGTAGSGTATITSDDNNICSDTTGNLTQANDMQNTSANLAALANNGGLTMTHRPQVGSPAIDKGRAIGGVTTDQRGITRPIDDPLVANAANGDGSDIGAVEAETPPQVSVGTSNWVNAGGGLYTLILGPGDAIADNLIATDPGAALMTVTVTAPIPVLAGLTTEPTTNSTAVAGPIDLEWVGTADAGNAPGMYDWLIQVDNGSASTSITARIILQDFAPAHAIQNATGGNGSSGSPYTIAYTVGLGAAGATNLAAVTDPNVGQTLTVGGVTPPTGDFAFSISSGYLRVIPSGSAVAGSQQFEVQVSDGGLNTISIFVSITVNAAPAFTTTSPLSNAEQGQPYTQSVTASGGTGGLSFAALSTLPGSLIFSGAGNFSGLPGLAGGPFNISLEVTDMWGIATAQVFVLTVDPPTSGGPTITTPSPLAPAVTGQPYQVTLQATGGAGGYTFALTGGALPPGLSLNASGDISGSATSAGSFSFTVTVTDSVLAASATPFTLDVSAPGGGSGGGGDDGGCSSNAERSWLLVSLFVVMLAFGRTRSGRAGHSGSRNRS